MQDFLVLKNQLVNADHIVRAEFCPAYDGGEDDVDSGVPGKLTKPRLATLKLTLTSVHPEPVFAYEDVSMGVAAESDAVQVSGDEAERAWGILNVWKKQAERKRYIADE